MIHTLFKSATTALCLALAPIAALADGPWEGTWSTSYSDLRLVQEGAQVYGEYVGRGYITGWTDPSGSILRGTWVHDDTGRWGALEFRLEPGANTFQGSWVEDQTTFNFDDGTNWDGTRENGARPALPPGLAIDLQVLLPADAFAWSQNPFGNRTPAPAPAPAPQGVSCPTVALTNLQPANNIFVTPNGISNAASAPWTIYAHPPAAPLGALAFVGGPITYTLDACIPLAGPSLGANRATVLIHQAVLSRRGDGDFQGVGRFHDSATGVRGDVQLFLTNPEQGQGLAALTITGLDGRWSESVLLDYMAD